MAGDGIKDVPALATSSIGFSIGVAGTEIAIETSDVAVMNEDLSKIPEFIALFEKDGSAASTKYCFGDFDKGRVLGFDLVRV